MYRPIRPLFAILLFVTVGLCQAGGSVSFEDVERLLRSQPATYKWLSSTLELPDTADAEIRFGNHFKHLGGARMGPYTFRAKQKGVTSAVEIDVTVCAEAEFYDQSGKKITKAIEQKAVRVEEKLTAILVRDARDDGAAPACPR